MATDVVTSPSSAAPGPAPAAAPAASSPASVVAPASDKAPVSGASRSTAPVDPAKFPVREDYARELLKEKLAAIGTPDEPPVAEAPQDTAPVDPSAENAEAAEVLKGDSVDVPSADNAPAVETEEADFELEPEAIVTPENLSQMLKENAEFGKLLEADPKLKGQLYKTAREAAELKPYRELFPDLESAKSAQNDSATWVDVRETFLGSASREGTVKTLAKIAELSYERDADGNVTLANGEPVIGDDFYGFVDNVAGLNLAHRSEEVEARLQANRYASDEARARDVRVKAALDVLRDDDAPAAEDAPAVNETLRRKQEDLDRRERELNQRLQSDKLQERRSFEASLQEEAQKRFHDGIGKILANVEKQGAVVSPYLKNILPKAIGAKLISKIQSNPTLQGQMQELQRLPVGDASRQRRLAAIDRAVQQYLPDVAREELREAGVQIAAAAQTKRARVDAQIDATKKTEPKGSTGPASSGSALNAGAAFEHAQAEWQRANPGRPFDKIAKDQILPRVLQLMQAR